jgi:hypothetical protein
MSPWWPLDFWKMCAALVHIKHLEIAVLLLHRILIAFNVLYRVTFTYNHATFRENRFVLYVIYLNCC